LNIVGLAMIISINQSKVFLVRN